LWNERWCLPKAAGGCLRRRLDARPAHSAAAAALPRPPGVARSIESDVDNLMRLIAVANVLPRGLFVEVQRRGPGGRW
jgi:hypothetical protein